MDAIDWHAHVFLRSLPMAPERRYTPRNDAPLALLRRLLLHNRLAGAVLVQPSFLGTANAFLLSALKELRRAESSLQFWGVVAVEADRDLAQRMVLDELANGLLNLRHSLPLPTWGCTV